MYAIGKFSKATGISTSTLRRWDREDKFKPAFVSDGGTRPYRVHYRDPSFTNLQAVAAMGEGGMVADVIVAVASIDPVMGGVDR